MHVQLQVPPTILAHPGSYEYDKVKSSTTKPKVTCLYQHPLPTYCPKCVFYTYMTGCAPEKRRVITFTHTTYYREVLYHTAACTHTRNRSVHSTRGATLAISCHANLTLLAHPGSFYNQNESALSLPARLDDILS